MNNEYVESIERRFTMTDIVPQMTIDAFNRDGFAVLRGFMSRQEIQDLLAEIDRYAREVAPTLPPEEVYFEEKGKLETLQRLNRMGQYDTYFDRLKRSEKWVSAAEGLLGETVSIQHIMYFTKPVRVGGVTPPHQDAYYWMIEPGVGLTFWLALDTVDETNGCVRYVRGSHLYPVRPHAPSNVLGFSQTVTDYGDQDEQAEVAVEAEPGDLLVHHGRTIHRADANLSERPRPALGLVYYTASSKVDEARFAAYRQQLQEKLLAEGKI